MADADEIPSTYEAGGNSSHVYARPAESTPLAAAISLGKSALSGLLAMTGSNWVLGIL